MRKSVEFRIGIFSKKLRSQNPGNFGGSIEFSCYISLAVKGLRLKVIANIKHRLVSDVITVITGREGLCNQVWEHTPEQRVAASTLRRYSFVLRLAIAQADARPVMSVSFR